MTQDLEKAKKILTTKLLCFMQWQVDDAKARGHELMEQEDIEFILSLDGITQEEILTFNVPEEERYTPEALFKKIEEAKSKNLKGIIIMCDVLGDKLKEKIQEIGFFVKNSAWNSIVWDEIYFLEEDFVRAEISDFKNLFGSFASVAQMI